MIKTFKHLKRDFSKWSFLTIAIALFISIPIFSIVIYMFDGVGEMWQHIVNHFLFDYIKNSFILILGTGTISVFFGVSTAWIVSQYEFRFRKTIEKVLFLPLAIPSYILAYVYVGLVGNDGTIIRLLHSVGIEIKRVDFMNIYGLVWVLSFSLYPYVYASTRAMLMNLPKSLYENSLLLGASNRKYFWSIVLPLISPAIIGGLFLVFMEVLNDYGAAKYYGINTFTTGIFRTWTMLEDLQSAIYLSSVLVLLVFVLNGLVIWQRGRKSYAVKGKGVANKISRKHINANKKIIYYSILSIPIIFGFILPVGQLLYWLSYTFDSMFSLEILWVAFQTISLALISALLIIVVALTLIYFYRWNHISKINLFKKIATIGYVIPGAIIGIGIIRSSQSIIDFFTNTFNLEIGYLFYGSSFVLIYAYIFRFLTVAYNPLESNSLKIGKKVSEASYMMGVGKIKTFFKVELPLIKGAILSSFLVVFIDVLKELPLTLILKPYNLQTLAVTAFSYADDERVAESALPALMLIIIIMLMMFFINLKGKHE